jgi:hypothetical protein
MILSRLSCVVGALAAAALLPAQNAVLQWNEAALAAIRATSTSPPAASRQLAMLHTAILFGGIHWLSANVYGLSTGAQIGVEVSAQLLRRL